jgi:cell division septation protein DedD
LNGPDEQTSASGSSALQLPATEEPLPIRSQTLNLADDGSSPDSAAPPATAPLPSVAAAAVEEEPDVAPGATALAAVEPPPAVAVAPKPEPVREAPKAAAPPVAAPKPAPAARAPAQPASAVKGGWTVQLGVFGEEANARRLAERVRTFGYKPEVSTIKSGGKTLYRVRTGQSAARGEADATASALAAHGVTARVVAAE